jgi:ribonuclease HI
MTDVNEIHIYTDGCSLGNPGKGGWAAILLHKGKSKQISGGFRFTTNNRMEILAAIEALKALKIKTNKEITLFTDSRLVHDAFDRNWITEWKKHGWRKPSKEPVLNVDLWQELDDLVAKYHVKFTWVKAHNGDVYNEKCDKLSKSEAAKKDLPPDEEYESANPVETSNKKFPVKKTKKSDPKDTSIGQLAPNQSDSLIQITKTPVESHFANSILKFQFLKSDYEDEDLMIKVYQTDPNVGINIPFQHADAIFTQLIKDIKEEKNKKIPR